MKRVLILAAHPDDDALGCGGAIAMHVAEGSHVRVIYATRGERGIPGVAETLAGQTRRDEGGQAQACLGIGLIMEWQMPDGGLTERFTALYEGVRKAVADMRPEIIYAPHQNDGHADHRALAQAARMVFDESHGFRLRQYEVWTPLTQPNLILDITPYVTLKRAAMRCHVSQESRNGFVEAILSLNHYRGLMHGPNLMYAEAFHELTP